MKFVASGVKPRKNKDVMGDVINELKQEGLFYGDKVPKKDDATKDESSDEEPVVERKRDKKEKDKTDKKAKKDKKEKKDKKKKDKKRPVESDEEVEEKPKKKAKKSK